MHNYIQVEYSQVPSNDWSMLFNMARIEAVMDKHMRHDIGNILKYNVGTTWDIMTTDENSYQWDIKTIAQ